MAFTGHVRLLLFNTTQDPKHEGLYRYGRRCGRHSLLYTDRSSAGGEGTGLAPFATASTREPCSPVVVDYDFGFE
jgi:hypothetical protein